MTPSEQRLPWREWGAVMDLNPRGDDWVMKAWWSAGRLRVEVVGSTPGRAFAELLRAMTKEEAG